MLLVMYSLKETVLNIHIKTRNTLKKVLHWTVFFVLLLFFVHISYETFTSTYLHSAKTHLLSINILQTLWWKLEQQETCTQHTFFIKLDFQNPKYDIQYTVPSHLGASHCIQPDILHLHTASPSTGWNLSMTRYQIQLSNWIPTV